MKVNAKCHNYSGCLLAYRGEEIELESGAPLVCPECGKPLTVVKSGAAGIWRAVPWVLGLALLAVGIWFARPLLQGLRTEKADGPATTATATPTPRPTPRGQPLTPGGTVMAGATPAMPQPEAPVAEPPPVVTAPQQLDLDAGSEENKKVKQEVLTRIDLMPNISETNKDKLYNSVERARSMGKVLTVPFGSGKTTLGGSEAQALVDAMQSPELSKLRDDPTAVFVVLGYADPKGDAKKNLEYSQARADAVIEVMRDKAGVMNVTHAVAMGGSTLLDSENLEKNRIAEIWAVLP